MNHLQPIKSLHNTYYAMRHGHSKANAQGVVISHPRNGLHEDYALSELGREQVLAAAKCSHLTDKILIYCSDFSRAIETAYILQSILGTPEIHTSKRLRERYFGDWEKADLNNVYSKVWESDRSSADHTEYNVEAANAVLDRVTALIVNLERRYQNKDILLVSHGDTLQILQVGFMGMNASRHRSLPHLEVAEIRRLSFTAP